MVVKVLIGQFRTTFFVILLLGIGFYLNMLEYLRFIKVIDGCLTLDEIALKFERTLVK